MPETKHNSITDDQLDRISLTGDCLEAELARELLSARKLIAAAPDLLESCRKALDSLTLGAEQFEAKYYPKAGPMNIIDDLRTAIARAEGKLGK